MTATTSIDEERLNSLLGQAVVEFGATVNAALVVLGDPRGKLDAGGRIATIGCGQGAWAIIMAEAFPKSRVHGSDYHQGSIAEARRLAAEAGVDDRATFAVEPAEALAGGSYDLVTS